MPELRLPWPFGPSEEVKKALVAVSKAGGPLRGMLVDAIKNSGYPFKRAALKKQAQAIHAADATHSEAELFAILDALTDLILTPKQVRDVLLTDWMEGTDGSVKGIQEIINEAGHAPAIIEQRQVSRFMELALPRLMDIERVCAVRARFAESFRYSEDSIENYKPTVSDYHPVVILKVELSGGWDDAVFQLDQDSLDRLIAELIAAQKELRVALEDWKKIHAGGASEGRT